MYTCLTMTNTTFTFFYQHLKTQPLWLLLLVAIGFSKLVELSITILKWIYANFIRPAKDLNGYGSWALVTGPTDGIGKAFAFQLAQRGLNLVLVGRNPTKLKHVSDSVTAKYKNIKIKCVVVDYTGDLDEEVRRIREAIEGIDVGVLINNVGISYPCARYFHEVDDELLSDLINVNVKGITKITQAVLPGMLQRKRGAIVNIGSGIAIALPSAPLHALYSATKAYIHQFSRSLHVEYKNRGIDVQCQVPLYVATKMVSSLSIRRTSFFIPSAEDYAKSALRWIGYEVICTPYWPHSLQLALVRSLPQSAVDTWRLNFCLRIRKRELLKIL